MASPCLEKGGNSFGHVIYQLLANFGNLTLITCVPHTNVEKCVNNKVRFALQRHPAQLALYHCPDGLNGAHVRGAGRPLHDLHIAAIEEVLGGL